MKASNTRSGAYFGTSVAISGDTMVVGSYGESSSTSGINGDQSNTAASSSWSSICIYTKRHDMDTTSICESKQHEERRIFRDKRGDQRRYDGRRIKPRVKQHKWHQRRSIQYRSKLKQEQHMYMYTKRHDMDATSICESKQHQEQCGIFREIVWRSAAIRWSSDHTERVKQHKWHQRRPIQYRSKLMQEQHMYIHEAARHGRNKHM